MTGADQFLQIIGVVLSGLILIVFLRRALAYLERTRTPRRYRLIREECNPVIAPNDWNEWERHGTFNPAAFLDDCGKTHLIYRAVGTDGISRLGHAVADDGVIFSIKSSFPVFEPSRGYGLPDERAVRGPSRYDPVAYASGGGWGGAEDPRAVVIDGVVYLTYVAFESWDSVRIALTSIPLSELKAERWNWKKPTIISPLNERHKNWVLFPEKIRGKYAILHGVTPRVMVDYVDDLDEPFVINSDRGEGPQPGREDFWDNRMRGAGAPPIKTPDGWLVLYHAIDDREPHKYKLGAFLLDLDDPTIVHFRSHEPILEPDMHYENDSKPGIVYASGAVVRGDTLFVYYGGGDRHVCVARASLSELLHWLKTGGAVQ